MRYKQLNIIFIMISLFLWSSPAFGQNFVKEALEWRITELFSTHAIVLNYESEIDLKTTLVYTGGIGQNNGHTFFVIGYGTKYYFEEILNGLYTGISLEFTTNKESRRYDLGVLGYEYAEIKKSVDFNLIGKLGYIYTYQKGAYIATETDLIIAAHLEDPKIYLSLILIVGKKW